MLVKSATVASSQGTHASASVPSAQDKKAHAIKVSRVIKDQRPGLTVERFFTRQGVDPFETVEWERRDAVISGADGKVFFEQRNVEFPKTWSQTATNVVVQKYFRGTLGTPKREDSVRQMVARVADTIYGWGKADAYFKSEAGRVGVPRRARAPAPAPEDGVQLAGLVQRRRRGAPAVLGVLHQLGR